MWVCGICSPLTGCGQAARIKGQLLHKGTSCGAHVYVCQFVCIILISKVIGIKYYHNRRFILLSEDLTFHRLPQRDDHNESIAKFLSWDILSAHSILHQATLYLIILLIFFTVILPLLPFPFILPLYTLQLSSFTFITCPNPLKVQPFNLSTMHSFCCYTHLHIRYFLHPILTYQITYHLKKQFHKGGVNAAYIKFLHKGSLQALHTTSSSTNINIRQCRSSYAKLQINEKKKAPGSTEHRHKHFPTVGSLALIPQKKIFRTTNKHSTELNLT